MCACSKVYELIDNDKNGALEKRELFKTQYHNNDPDTLADMWKKMDEDGDGVISPEEWIEYWERTLQKRSEATCNERLTSILKHVNDTKQGLTNLKSKVLTGAALQSYATNQAIKEESAARQAAIKEEEAAQQVAMAKSLESIKRGEELLRIAEGRNSSNGLMRIGSSKPQSKPKPNKTLAEAFQKQQRKKTGPAGRYQRQEKKAEVVKDPAVSLALIEKLAEKVFGLLDSDNSGTIVMKEVMRGFSSDHEASDIMKTIDASLDGDISIAEWRGYWIGKGERNAAITEMQIKRIKGRLNRVTNRSKKKTYIMRPPDPQITKLATTVFEMLDTDGSGMLILAELLEASRILSAHGNWAANMMREMDMEQDGDISLMEWRMYWSSTNAGNTNSVERKLTSIKTKLKKMTRSNSGPALRVVDISATKVELIKRLAENVFNLLDEDDSGTIVLKEVMHGLQDDDGNEARAIMETIDTGHDSSLDLAEWIQYWERQARHNPTFTESQLKRFSANVKDSKAPSYTLKYTLRPKSDTWPQVKLLALKVFQLLDMDDSGILILSEMMNLEQWSRDEDGHSIQSTDLEAQEWAIKIMHDIDKKQDGDVTLKEWKLFWQSTQAGEDDAVVANQLRGIKNKLVFFRPRFNTGR